jgi:dienelactone hydrolase
VPIGCRYACFFFLRQSTAIGPAGGDELLVSFMKRILIPLVLLVALLVCKGEILTEPVEYKDGDTVLEGLVTRDTAAAGQRPGILIVHQWKGIGNGERRRAEMLAKLGYVAFCADIYGKGVRPSSIEDAGAQAGKYKKDRALLRSRVQAGLATLRKQAGVNPSQIAAIGYCFGGTTVLELARSGADVAGVVTFHGGLDSPNPADGKKIKCKVLVLHGAEDPFVPAKDIEAFQSELRDAKVDWQMVYYSGAVHSFTDLDAGSLGLRGAAYDEKADHRSWEAMKTFFNEIFSR